MTKTETTKPTPAKRIADLFTIEPTYQSKSGTGRTCQTIQGYRLSGPVIAPAGNYYLTKRDAQNKLFDMQLWATGDADTSNVSDTRLRWLVQILGVDGAPTAHVELARRQAEAETRVKTDEASTAEHAAFKARVRKALSAMGFTSNETNRVSVKAAKA